MRTDFERRSLPLARPFTISRGTQETAEVVTVAVSDGEATGHGAAAPSAYYGETAATVEAVLPDLLARVEEVADPLALERVERACREVVRDNPAARAAVSVACHDLAARRVGLPLYRFWGLDPDPPDSSFTVGIDDPETVREKTREAVDAGHDVLKVKVGTGDDEATLAAVREAAPDATVRVDANGAWTPREAVRRVDALAAYDLEFVEQPVPAGADLRFVRERSPVPIAADESCVTAADVPGVAGAADVVVLKLMKCGGLRAAREFVHAAHAAGLEVMVGCMVESQASIAAAAHLAPLVEYADLDGSLLLAEDPYEGVPFEGSRVRLDAVDRPGTGVRERA